MARIEQRLGQYVGARRCQPQHRRHVFPLFTSIRLVSRTFFRQRSVRIGRFQGRGKQQRRCLFQLRREDVGSGHRRSFDGSSRKPDARHPGADSEELFLDGERQPYSSGELYREQSRGHCKHPFPPAADFLPYGNINNHQQLNHLDSFSLSYSKTKSITRHISD